MTEPQGTCTTGFKAEEVSPPEPPEAGGAVEAGGGSVRLETGWTGDDAVVRREAGAAEGGVQLLIVNVADNQ